MAIPYNVIPFTLLFKLNFYNDKERIFHVTEYYETERELFESVDKGVLEIKENIPFDVIFDCADSNAKFYMDGLDALPEQFTKEGMDDGEAYLSPSSDAVTLYGFNETDEYYPYIPGLYRIRIVVAEQIFFSWLKVIPKEIDESQWENMKNDVELEMRGLAQDLLRSSYGFSNQLNSTLPPAILQQYLIINKKFSNIMSAISDLYVRVNFKIKKEYVVVPVEKSGVIDEITIRHRVIHPETKDVIKTPLKKINYDLPENRLVKQIIQFLLEKLTDFITSVELYQEEVEQEIVHLSHSYYDKNNLIHQKKQVMEQLKIYLETAKKMRKMLNWSKTASWYKEVSANRVVTLPHVMISDVRYRSLYQIYRELHNETIDISFDELFVFQWKRTDKLYELWGFLQFIKFLQHPEIGFKPKEGWIYDEDFNIEQIMIPSLPKGKPILFEKEQLTVKLVYEGKLPSRSDNTDVQNQPLYTTGTNNWPDGRLDVYQTNVYIGSLLFDFKYRPKTTIWQPAKVTQNAHTKTMRQLVGYAFNCRSNHLFGDKLNHYLLETINPIPEVWALYPRHDENERNRYFRDHHIRLLELSPGYENEHLIKELNQLFQNLVRRAE